jgi:N-acetylmuramoyl-L-alanine amidase
VPVDHIVQQGEHLTQIAHKHGFSNIDPIWNAPENAQLKKERGNPNVLHPGDKVVIPDKELKELDKATGKRHTFELQGEKLRLRVALHGLRNRPLSGHEGTMVVEFDSKDFTTESDGMIELDIAPEARSGTLIDRGPPPGPNRVRLDRTIALRIGFLDPVKEISGQIARLNNLGYDAGEILDRIFTSAETEEIKKSIRFRSAVEEFQCDFKLSIDGVCGPNTQAKLVEVHGS